MCIIIESYLPPDFFHEMYGANSHSIILYKLCQQYSIMPELLETLDRFSYSLLNFTAKQYLSLFSHTLPVQASLRILDLFLLIGQHRNKIIFDITLGYLRAMEPYIVKSKDQEELNEAMKIKDIFEDPSQLMRLIRQASVEIR